MAKKRVAVLFGGASKEYETSLFSAYAVITALPKDKYEVVPVGITQAARWLFYPGPPEKILSGEWANDSDNCSAILSPDPMHKGFLKCDGDCVTIQRVDGVFSVLLGKYGDCGHIHGLCKLSGVPFVGSDYAAMAACSDKMLTRLLLSRAGLTIPEFVYIERVNLDKLTEEYFQRLEEAIGYPCHVKSASCSPIFGSNLAENRDELKKCIKNAFTHHHKIIIEENVVGRLFECAVYGNAYNLKVSEIAEHVPVETDAANEYVVSGGTPDFCPNISDDIKERIKSTARYAFLTMGCKDYAKASFVLKEDGRLYCTRINAMCGFYYNNMLPRLIMGDGFTYEEVLCNLIENAL
jgi:D-alanine--D-alanine ligase